VPMNHRVLRVKTFFGFGGAEKPSALKDFFVCGPIIAPGTGRQDGCKFSPRAIFLVKIQFLVS